MPGKPILKSFNDVDNFAEHYLLKSIIDQPELLENIKINEDLFNFSKSKRLFNSITKLVSRKSQINKVNLKTEYDSQDLLDMDSGFIDDIFSLENEKKNDVESLIYQLQDSKKRIVAIKNLELAVNKIKESGRLTEDIIKETKNIISDAESSLAGSVTDINQTYTIPQWIDLYNDETKTRRNGKQYNFHHFIMDKLISDGPTPGDFGIITSRSGSGKSALCLNIINNLINVDVPVMYFSLEMGAITTMDRLIAIRLQIPYSDIAHPKDPDTFDQVKQKIEQERAELESHENFRFCGSPTISLNDIKKHIQKFQADIDRQYCIVFIDLLSMVQDFTKSVNGQNSAFTMEVGVNKFHAICRELGVHGVGVVQLNRNSDEKVNDLDDIKKLRPTINQIKNAKAFEERARWVIGTHRSKHYATQFLKELENDPDFQAMDDIMEIMVLKQNSGLLGNCNAIFNGPTFSVIPIENGIQSDV